LEIINFFEKYYLIDQKEIDRIINKRIGMPKTINKHGEKLYNIFLNKEKGPADIADFLIDLGEVYQKNMNIPTSIKLKNFRKDSHSLKEWVKLFKENFPKILNNDQNFTNLFKTLFSIAYRKINKLDGINEFTDKVGEITDKLSDNQEEKTKSKWEIINFFEKNSLIEQKEIDWRVKKIGLPDEINEKAEKLYNIFISNDTGPADIADFLIHLNDIFKVNAEKRAIDKIKDFQKDNHSLKEWEKFFKEKFLKILSDEECFPNLFKILFTKAYRKLDDGKKLITNEDNNNNSSEPPKK
jgi:hypothetical protein